MIVLHTRAGEDEKNYRFFEVNDDSVTRMDLPIDEDGQTKLKN